MDGDRRAKRSRSSPASLPFSAMAMWRASARRWPEIGKDAAHLSRPQRTGHGPCGHRLCQGQQPPAHDGLHHLHRARRHQHGDRRGRRPCRPPAGPAAARRHLRQPPARSGAAADREFRDPTISANDCFKPVARFWDRITRPEQLAREPAPGDARADRSRRLRPGGACLPQDVQAEAGEYPESFFDRRIHRLRRPGPDDTSWRTRSASLRKAKAPIIIAGGGVHYSEAAAALADFAGRRGIPVAETQAGKGALPWTHELNIGSIGVTGSAASQRARAQGRCNPCRRLAPAGFHHRLRRRCGQRCAG